MTELPSGTVTFLFTDIEGSTKLLDKLGADHYGQVLSDQRTILRAAFEEFDGTEIDTQGDAFFASFPRASEAVAAAVQIQLSLAEHVWPDGVEVRVRMGLHTGEPLVAEEGYVGIDVHRAARIGHVGHGGQILLSETTTPMARGQLPDGATLVDLGSYQLKDIERPEPVHNVVIENLPSEFPPPTARLIQPPASTISEKLPMPAFLDKGALDQEEEHPVFVARETELARLDEFLVKAQGGQGQVAFISGGPGRGKTALMEAFAQRAMAANPKLLVASGGCDAYTGIGDPYLPFRDLLCMLTGDVETSWAAGKISTDHARRLWETLPISARSIVKSGPDLLGVFINPKDLLARAEIVDSTASWLIPLRELADKTNSFQSDLDQKSLFDQFEKSLRAVVEEHSLILIIDDLQWADSASLNLLFHLGRRLEGAPILILGAYRLEEVALGRDDQRHPLEKVLTEFKRQYGEVGLDLSAANEENGREFVDAFLDTEPNRLSLDFRRALVDHTGGHPLFTGELLRNLQERGNVTKDADGFWIEGPQLDWSVLPARVEGVIEERIGRLTDDLRETLTVASVEGEDFTAQVVARVQESDERGLLRQLNRELNKRHRLVGEQGQTQIGTRKFYNYRFRHSLFQQHLYNGLSEVDRQLLHGDVGAVLETLYGEHANEIASQLAWHYIEAGEGEKAVPYLIELGDRARRLLAQEEAVRNYQKALEFLMASSNFEEAAKTLMKLGLTYHTVFEFKKSRQAFNEAFEMRKLEGSEPPSVLLPAPHPFRLVVREPSTLDPTLALDGTALFYIDMIFSGLVELGRGYEIIPDVAQSWEISESGREYLFHLRDDVFWSDGYQVKAMDFEYAVKRTLNPATKAPQDKAILLYDIEGAREYHLGEITDPNEVSIRAIDDLTLAIGLKRPASYFFHLLGNNISPVPRHVVKAHGNLWTDPEHIVSNGPFLLESFQSGEAIRLKQNPTYHGRFFGNTQQIECNISVPPDSHEELELYELDNLDMVNMVATIIHARHRHVEEYVSEPVPSTFFVSFDNSCSPFDDLRVRQAFVLAVDREKMIEEVLDGMRNPANGGLVPPGIPGHSPEIGLPFDPEQALKLLAHAGYPGGRDFPKVEISWVRKEPALIFLTDQWLDNLNVEVSTKEMNLTDLLKDGGIGKIRFMGWTDDYPDPDNFLRVCVQRNIPHWRNNSYDRLLEQAQETLNQGDRIPLYQAADKILMEEAAIMPLTYFTEHQLIKPWVKIPGGSTGNWHIKNVIIEPHDD